MNAELALSPFADVLSDFRAGKMIVMVDDEKRENEGDLIIATEAVDAAAVNFMTRQGRGLVCVSIGVELAEKLNLPLQTLANNSIFQTPFAVSIDYREVLGFGVTARGRAQTMRRLVEPGVQASDFISPGHVFPLIANPLGVLGRQGQTEGTYDLARVAGLKPSGVLCEVLHADGSMARGAQLGAFAREHGLKVTSVAELAHYRVSSEVLVRQAAQSILKTDYGEFTVCVFVDDADGKEHLALLYGESRLAGREQPPLVRMHSECLTGDVFGSKRCDCGQQLALAMETIVKEGAGVIVYLRQEGRGIGLANKVRAYALQDQGSDTVEANVKLGFAPDLRDFAVAAKILGTLGIREVRLMTNNPAKVERLRSLGLKVRERVPSRVVPNEFNRAYLDTKRHKLGHLL